MSTGINTLVSVNKTNNGGANDDAEHPSISADGTAVAFASRASNLSALKNFGVFSAVYARKLTTNTTVLVSVDPTGTFAASADSLDPVISASGNVVAFRSSAPNLSPLKTSSLLLDVFARNLTTNTTYLVSVNKNNNGAGDGQSDVPVISADGNVVAFASYAGNLSLLDTNGSANQDIFARNLATGVTSVVSLNLTGGTSSDSSSFAPSISGDGQVISFCSSAKELTILPTGPQPDAYVRNLATGKTTLASVNQSGSAGGNSASLASAVSADGKIVAFFSYATDLSTAVDENSTEDLYVRDLLSGQTILGLRRAASVPSKSAGGSSFGAVSVSADGRDVAFVSQATNLVAGLHNSNDPIDSPKNVYRYDRVTVVAVVSVGSDGTSYGAGDSINPRISADGNIGVF